MGESLGWCGDSRKRTGVRVDRAGRGNAVMAGQPGSGVAGETEGAVWAVVGAVGERGCFD